MDASIVIEASGFRFGQAIRATGVANGERRHAATTGHRKLGSRSAPERLAPFRLGLCPRQADIGKQPVVEMAEGAPLPAACAPAAQHARAGRDGPPDPGKAMR